MKKYEDYLIYTRRELHKIPELEFDLPKTINFIATELKKMNYEYKMVLGSIVVEVGINTPVVLIRADIDALPINEENELEFKSIHENKMHACGHDSHGALLLTLLKYIKEEKVEVLGKLICVFQANEEGGPPSGAKNVVEGLNLSYLDLALAIHISPSIEVGVIGLRANEYNANCDGFKVNIIAKGGHAAYPHNTIDPIQIFSELYYAIHLMKTREIDQVEKSVISITKVHSGTAFNIVPDSLSFEGTIRTYNDELRDIIFLKIARIIKSIESLHDIKIDYQPIYGCPSVLNDEDIINLIEKELLKNNVKTIRLKQPAMGADDFSYFSRLNKGVMLSLGVNSNNNMPLHNPRFIMNEAGLIKGLITYDIVLRALKVIK